MDEPGGAWVYEIRVEGHLDDVWAGWFEGLALDRGPEGVSTLAGPVAGQAALHGLLARVRDLGLVLLSVKLLDRGRGMQSAGKGPLEEEAQ